MSEVRKPKYKKTKLHIKWDGETVEGKTDIAVMGNALALFAGACGADRVAKASKKTNPTVMTDEKAHEITKNKKNLETRPLPQYSGYSYLAWKLKNGDKRDRLSELADQLGISDRVEVELEYRFLL